MTRRRATLGTAALVAATVVAVDAGVHGGGASAVLVAGGTVCASTGIIALVVWAATHLARRLLPATARPWPIPIAIVMALALAIAVTVPVAGWIAARHRDPAMIGVTVAALAAVLAPLCIAVMVPPCVAVLRWPAARGLAAARGWPGLAPRVAWALVVLWAIGAVVTLAVVPGVTVRGPLASRALEAWVAITDPDGDGRGLGGPGAAPRDPASHD